MDRGYAPAPRPDSMDCGVRRSRMARAPWFRPESDWDRRMLRVHVRHHRFREQVLFWEVPIPIADLLRLESLIVVEKCRTALYQEFDLSSWGPPFLSRSASLRGCSKA